LTKPKFDVLMRPRRNAMAALLITALPTTAASMLRIADDHGGNVGVYLSRYMALRDAGEQIIIDGTCSSACTLVLAIVPHDRICVTANAYSDSTPLGVPDFSVSTILGHERSGIYI
jgi:hypothetical protein